MRRRRLVAAATVLALVLVLGACDRATGSGVGVRALGPITGLEPGDEIEVRVSGAQPGQTVFLFQCAGGSPSCQATDTTTAVADQRGAVTTRWRVRGVAPSQPYDGFDVPREACRPTGCVLSAATALDPWGNPTDPVAQPVALGLNGEQVTFSASPTEELIGGEHVAVSGRVPGAEGRRIRIARAIYSTPRNERGIRKIGSSAYVTVLADGTFSGTFTLPTATADQPADCGDQFAHPCVLTAWVVKADGSAIDPSFGKPFVYLLYTS